MAKKKSSTTVHPTHKRSMHRVVGDSLYNAITLAGTSRDKREKTTFLSPRMLSGSEIQSLGEHALIKKVLCMEAFEATREGSWTHVGIEDVEKKHHVEQRIHSIKKMIGFQQKVRKALSRMNQWGSSILVMGVNEGLGDVDLSTPVGDRIVSIDWLRELSKGIDYAEGPEDLENKENYGRPQYFEVQASRGFSSHTVRVHWSRVLYFSTDSGHSILNGLKKPFQSLIGSFNSADIAMSEHSVANYKVTGLVDAVIAGKEDQIRKRIEIAEYSKSMINAYLSDKDLEDFEYQSRPVGGIGEIIDRFLVLFAAASGQPMTKLYGVSPGGFGTGEHERQNFENSARAFQTDKLEPEELRLTRYIARSEEVLGESEGAEVPISIEYKAIRLLTESEKADLEKKDAECTKIRADTLATLVNAQIVTPEEARLAMANEIGSFGVRLDDSHAEARAWNEDQRLLIEDLRELKERARASQSD